MPSGKSRICEKLLTLSPKMGAGNKRWVHLHFNHCLYRSGLSSLCVPSSKWRHLGQLRLIVYTGSKNPLHEDCNCYSFCLRGTDSSGFCTKKRPCSRAYLALTTGPLKYSIVRRFRPELRVPLLQIIFENIFIRGHLLLHPLFYSRHPKAYIHVPSASH